jgi:CRISPR-associated protein Cas1
MKRLLNTLYITTPESYLSLDGENVVVLREQEAVIRVPLLNLEGIVAFGYTGASPALMGECAKRGIALSFMTAHGRFLAQVIGEERGNVILRKTQFRRSDSETESAKVARHILIGKIYNGRWVLERAARDHPLQLDVEKVKRAAHFMSESTQALRAAETLDSLRGIEGEAASQYFGVFDELILQNKDHFNFTVRSRRPPLDNVNALLSFTYTLLMHDISAAVSAVGLDPFIGFLHRDRPARRSLALDMLEELRAPVADRFVLTMINTRQVIGKDFQRQESGAVLLKDDARRTILTAWQKHKQEEIVHPYLKEKIPWGLAPHAQALLLARYLRGDLEAYPPFMWK